MLAYQFKRDMGGLPLCDVVPEGKLIYDVARQYDPSIDMTLTSIRDAFHAIEVGDPEFYKQFCMQQLNTRAEPQQLDAVLNNTRSRGRAALVTSMVVMIIALVACYCISMLYVAIYASKIPSYADLAIPLIIPGAVIWGYAGLLNKERKDMLAAALGDSPIGNSIVGKVATAFISAKTGSRDESK